MYVPFQKFLEVLENGHSKKITGLAFSGVLNILVSSDADAEVYSTFLLD